jgi:hypothetical protein
MSYIIIDKLCDPIKILDYTKTEEDMIKSYVSIILEHDKNTIEVFSSYNMREINKSL